MRDNDLDRQQAFDNAAWFVDNTVDLVVEYQIDSQAGNIIMDTLRQAGIPVIAVDIAMPGATFFGADNYRAGFIAEMCIRDRYNMIVKCCQGGVKLKLSSPPWFV